MEHNKLPTSKKIKRLRIQRMLNIVKTYVGCERCGVHWKPSLMQLHHTDSSMKKYKASGIIKHGTFKALQDELEKCEILCLYCHRRLHGNL